MHYKYKKQITKGANGTTLRHKQTEDNPIITLGEIDGYTYIYSAEKITGQNKNLNFTQISLTIDEIKELETQRYLNNAETTVLTAFKYANVTAIVQKILDDEAKSLGYDSINSAIVYIGSPNSKFNDEAIAFRDWKSDVWTKVEGIMEDVASGDREEPTLEEFIGELPTRL